MRARLRRFILCALLCALLPQMAHAVGTRRYTLSATSANGSAGDIVVWDNAAANSVTLSTTQGQREIAGVLLEDVTPGNVGRVAISGAGIPVNVTGTVAVGTNRFLRISATAGNAEGVASQDTTGVFGVSETADGTPIAGQVRAQLFSGAVIAVAPGSGVDEFTELIDTPSSYAGQGSNFARANAAATAMEFAAEIPDSEIAATIHRDSETKDADLVDNTPAGNIAATTSQAAINELDTEKSAVVHVHAGEDVTTGTVADARVDAAIHRDAEVKDGDLVSFDDPDANFAATNVDEAISELFELDGTGPNSTTGKVDWSQIVGMPSGFADGTDDAGAGGLTDNLSATRPPDANDDTTPGLYDVGSKWVDNTDDVTWFCLNNADGAAVWLPATEDVVLPTIKGRFWFVATNGNDGTGTGTIDAPYLTIQTAVDLARAGDAVIIRGGLYQITKEIDIDQADGEEGAPILITGYPGETATIDCQGDGDPLLGSNEMDAAFYVDSRDWITFKDLTFIDLDGGNAGVPRGLNGHGFILTIGAQHVTVDTIRGSNVAGPVGENTGAVFFGIGSHYPTVKNCHFTTIFNPLAHNHSGIFSDESDHGIFIDNIFDGTLWTGIFLKWSTTATNNGQIVERNKISGLTTANGQVPKGIWVTGDSSDANVWGRMRYNLIIVDQDNGIGIRMSENTSQTTGWEVAYNTIIDGGLMLHEQEHNSTNRVFDNWYHHNIFYTRNVRADVALMEFHSYSNGTNSDERNFVFEDNVVFSTLSSVPLFGVGDGAGGNDTDATVVLFEAGYPFVADASWKGGTGARNNSDTDPVLISTDGYIFSGASAVGKGYNAAPETAASIHQTADTAHGDIPMFTKTGGGSRGRWEGHTPAEAQLAEREAGVALSDLVFFWSADNQQTLAPTSLLGNGNYLDNAATFSGWFWVLLGNGDAHDSGTEGLDPADGTALPANVTGTGTGPTPLALDFDGTELSTSNITIAGNPTTTIESTSGLLTIVAGRFNTKAGTGSLDAVLDAFNESTSLGVRVAYNATAFDLIVADGAVRSVAFGDIDDNLDHWTISNWDSTNVTHWLDFSQVAQVADPRTGTVSFTDGSVVIGGLDANDTFTPDAQIAYIALFKGVINGGADFVEFLSNLPDADRELIGTRYMPGKFGEGRLYVGQDYESYSSEAFRPMRSSGTISLWVQPLFDAADASNDLSTTGEDPVVWQMDTDGTDGYALFYDVSAEAWVFQITHGGTAQTATSAVQTFTDGTWVHLTATWDAVNSRMRLYTDGTQVNTALTGELLPTGELVTNFTIGNEPAAAKGRAANAVLDHMKADNREWTQTEVTNEANATRPF